MLKDTEKKNATKEDIDKIDAKMTKAAQFHHGAEGSRNLMDMARNMQMARGNSKAQGEDSAFAEDGIVQQQLGNLEDVMSSEEGEGDEDGENEESERGEGDDVEEENTWYDRDTILPKVLKDHESWMEKTSSLMTELRKEMISCTKQVTSENSKAVKDELRVLQSRIACMRLLTWKESDKPKTVVETENSEKSGALSEKSLGNLQAAQNIMFSKLLDTPISLRDRRIKYVNSFKAILE